MKTVFVGQGPNRIAWERGLASGRKNALLRDGDPTPENEVEAHRYAERYCERVALTGSVGRRIGPLIGIDCPDFFRAYERRNLNARFNGKASKGDAFDRIEGRRRAAEIEAEGFTHYVLCGEQVTRCFGLHWGEPLELREKKDLRRVYFLLPHPSGIVQWWNEPFNVSRAGKRLREFLNLTNA